MTRVHPHQENILAGETSHLGVVPVPVGLRAQGLSRVLGYYDSLARTNVRETHVRLGQVASEVFAKTFGVGELMASGIDEETAYEMANDFYSGTNNSGYNFTGSNFVETYRGKHAKPARKAFQQVLAAEVDTFPIEPQSYEIPQPAQPTVRHELDAGKVILPRHTYVVQPASYDGVAPEDKITLGRLVKLAGEGIDDPWPHEEPSIPLIKNGLYIPPQDPRFDRAELLVRVGVDLKSNANGNVGVVFPPEEFKTVARSPRDLVRHMQATTRRANETNDDPHDVAERTGRSAGHVLSQKMTAMIALGATLEGDQTFLRKMYKELRSPWIAHYKSKNLEIHRTGVDEMIHDTAEVASINLNLGTNDLKTLHNGIKKKLYGGNRTHREISEEWKTYITLVGQYIGMRLTKIEASVQLCETELTAYQPFLDRKSQAA